MQPSIGDILPGPNFSILIYGIGKDNKKNNINFNWLILKDIFLSGQIVYLFNRLDAVDLRYLGPDKFFDPFFEGDS